MKNSVISFLEEVNNKAEVRNFEAMNGLSFPKLYKEIVSCHDGAQFQRDNFTFFHPRSGLLKYGFTGGFLCWKSDKDERIFDTYQDPPEFFPKGLLVFASNGGGDYLCFDYRKVKKDPPIVIWLHEEPEGEDVAFVANSFEEFIDNLKGDDELDK